MKKATIYSIFIFLWAIQTGFAQQLDTVFTYSEYIENIFQYHPIAKKAALRLEFGRGQIQNSKGTIDPKLTAGWDEKNFKDKLYFRKYRAKLKIPTPIGVSVVAGYENTEGYLLNPENKTDKNGLWNVGLEANILQGLLTNERRTALRQAKIFGQLAENEQKIILNDLVLDASMAYFYWQQYAFSDEILKENLNIATIYFKNTRQSFLNGEKTAMDTLEAFIGYQNAIIKLQNNQSDLIKSKQNVRNYLWFDDIPLELQPHTKPEKPDNNILKTPISAENIDLNNHPIILASLNDLSIKELEQRFKREKFKPKLKVKYNPLLAPSADNIAPKFQNFSANDYKIGLDFSMPLLFRKERGAVRMGKVKIEEKKITIQNKRNELQNKLNNSWKQQQLFQNQVNLLEKNVENYKDLLEGENVKFKYGESSVFLLNKRQEKYIGSKLKLIKTITKQKSEKLKFLYYSNQLVK